MLTTVVLVAAATLVGVLAQPGCADDSSGQIDNFLWGTGTITTSAHPRWQNATVTLSDDGVKIGDASTSVIDTFCITTCFQGAPDVWTLEGVNSGAGTVRVWRSPEQPDTVSLPKISTRNCGVGASRCSACFESLRALRPCV